jgi:putative nucleotidyltransferase with HDIG domain
MTTPRATPSPSLSPSIDPLAVLKGFASLRRLAGSYPAGHPTIAQKLKEIEDAIAGHLRGTPELRIDIIHGQIYVDGVSYSRDTQSHTPIVKELSDLGVDSIYIREGVRSEELLAVAELLWRRDPSSTESIESQLAARGVQSVSLGRLVPLDTRWRAQKWPDAPTGPLDPDYAESLARAQHAFDHVAAGNRLDQVTVRDLVKLLIHKVARSNAALGQILAVKQYENLTYCHSVNVAMLSLLIGRQLELDEAATAALVEAALLHDIGKTKIPLDIVKKPGALDKRERRLIEAHTTLGAELLVQTEGLRPLTPTVALEHHRGARGTGYPDLGDAVPHLMSQIVSVADIYEAITGARSYQNPTLPEHACLVLARLAGDKLNTALVKAFVNAITFFPIGSVVRTSREELGVVVETNPGSPLHPVLALVDNSFGGTTARVDTSARDGAGAYARHIVETIAPPEGFDVRLFLEAAA